MPGMVGGPSIERTSVLNGATAWDDVAIRRDLATRLATGLTYRVIALTDAEKGTALAKHARTQRLAALQVMARDQIAIDQPSYKPEGTVIAP